MSNMKDLYTKVAGDPVLQEQFNTILQAKEKAGQAATEERLLAFARDAGFEVSIAEMQDFFQSMAAQAEGELSDVELDQVAGGKSFNGTGAVIMSVLIALSCAVGSLVSELSSERRGQCARDFQ